MAKKVVKRLTIFYHYFSRKFLGQKRIQKLIGVNLVAWGVLVGSLPSTVNAYSNAMVLHNLSTAQFVPVQTTTPSSIQYPLGEYSLSQNFSWYHRGIDLVAAPQAPIYPLTEGVIESVNETFWGFGRYLIINHGNGFQTLYAHLSKINVKEGEEVGKETVIGLVGATGWATGNHLHLEVWQDGQPFNPAEVLEER